MAKSFAVKARLEAHDAASRVISGVRKQFGKLSGFLKDHFVITLGDVERMAKRVADALLSNVKAAQVQEDAVRALDASLLDLGSAADVVSRKLQDQAAAIESTTRYGDEAVIQAQAYLKTLGVQADLLPLATQATIDLAAALRIDLTSSARNVGKTVGGFAGELGEVIPELKDLDVAALRAGKGIELLADKFAGRAQEDAKTYSGLIDQIGNAFGTLQEKMGDAIIKNEKINAALTRLRDILTSEHTVEQVEKLAESVSELAEALISAATKLEAFVLGAKDLWSSFTGLYEVVAKHNPQLKAMSDLLGFSVSGYGRLSDAVSLTGQELVKQRSIMAETDRILERMAAASLEAEFGAKDLAAAYREEVAALDALNPALDRSRDAHAALTNEQRSAIEGLRALGIVLESDVATKIEKNNRLLEEARQLYYDQIQVNGELVVSAEVLAATEARVAEENARLTGSVRVQNEVLEAAAESFEVAAEGADGYASSIDLAAEATRRLAIEESLAAVGRGAGSTESAFGGTISGGSKLFPDSAIANTAVRGGQLVDVRSGGFRN